MFRRMTPPKKSFSNSSVNEAEYSESGPELENALTNKNWSLARKYVAGGVGMARKHMLHKAVRVNAPVEILELMVEKGCSVDESQEGNWTPLHVAAKYEAVPAVTAYLIKAGANVNSTTSTGETPIFLAADKDADALVELLIKSGADVNRLRSTDGMSPLMVVVHNHATPESSAPWLLQVLLTAGADVNATTTDGATALLIASSKGCSVGMLELLIKAGADVNRAKKNGETPLYVAAQRDASPAVVELLLKAGADVNRATLTGETPISIAAQQNVKPALLQVLIQAGADVNKASISGLTPVFGAVLAGSSKDLVQIMLSNGAEVASQHFQRKTALEVATDRGFKHLFEALDPKNTVQRVHFEKANFTFSLCAKCRKSDVNVSPCPTCGLVAYCSEECKTMHYKVGGHKDVCMAVLARTGEDDDED